MGQRRGLKYEIQYDERLKRMVNSIEDIVECGIPFFFGNRVNNWDEFLGLLDLGVTDIYVIEDMCFDLERVAIAAKLDAKGEEIPVFRSGNIDGSEEFNHKLHMKYVNAYK